MAKWNYESNLINDGYQVSSDRIDVNSTTHMVYVITYKLYNEINLKKYYKSQIPYDFMTSLLLFQMESHRFESHPN